MGCLLYQQAALISNKFDCSYCGQLLQPFCHISALTLQKGCNNSRYVYFIQLHRRTRFVRHRKRFVYVATGEEGILDIVPEGTELGNSGVLRGVWGVQNPPEIPKALQNLPNSSRFLKTAKNCCILDIKNPRCSEKKQ